ncbi:hypothetical protein AB0A69_10985 [Streptomyces sp. NPDC045431]|uniref:tetratricopeptide repeat protein n=1 Tax=Streptomyces sp. NPDC045431 TaxID=3155613 RepID=UPI0033EFDF35
MDEETRAAEVAAVRNQVSGGEFSAVVQSGSIGAVHVGAASPPDPFLWLPVRETDPVALGGRHYDGPYVLRDRDAELAELSGLVVVTGEPLSGKTTTAWAAMVRALPDHQVCVPPPGADLRPLARHEGGPWVLWLDDLEGHLHERGLDAGLLARLTSLGVPVLATMSDTAYDEHRFEPSPHARVLSRARTVELGLEWSLPELMRLTESGDPGHWFVLEGQRGRTNVTQYRGLGPDLWAEWQRARRPANHPRGHRLVRAAIDLHRCGSTKPLPVELLRQTHELYDVDAGSGESFEDALAWAARPRLGITGLLVEEPGGRWRAYGSLIVDAMKADAFPTLDAVWEAALAYDPMAVKPHAGVHYLKKAKAGDAEAMYRFARLWDDDAWLRKAADAGHTGACRELGRSLAGRGETREAERYLEAAAEAGDTEAALELGELLLKRAVAWLTKATDGGSPEAAHLLGDLYLGAGEETRAANLYEDAFAAGYDGVARSYGAYYRYTGAEVYARFFFQRAADAGDELGAAALGAKPWSPEDVEDYLREFAGQEEPMDTTHLGMLLEENGRETEARACYAKGFDLGDPYGAFRLARLLAKEGKPEAARAWMRKAADAGHPGAVKALAAEAGGADTVEG